MSVRFPPLPCAHPLPEKGRYCRQLPAEHLHHTTCRNGDLDRHHKYVEPTKVFHGDSEFVLTERESQP